MSCLCNLHLHSCFNSQIDYLMSIILWYSLHLKQEEGPSRKRSRSRRDVTKLIHSLGLSTPAVHGSSHQSKPQLRMFSYVSLLRVSCCLQFPLLLTVNVYLIGHDAPTCNAVPECRLNLVTNSAQGHLCCSILKQLVHCYAAYYLAYLSPFSNIVWFARKLFRWSRWSLSLCYRSCIMP